MVRLALLWLWSASVAASAPVPVRAAHVPLIAPDQAVMRLDELGLYRVGYAHDGKQETDKPAGWSGHFEEPSGMSCQPFGEQGGRSATLLHCPWRDGVGLAYQEFAFVVPRAKRVLVRGLTAMKTDVVGKSDGVTFRVVVNGRKLMERHQSSDAWAPFQFDVTRFAGRRLVVRFETDPGPKRDSSFDYSLWADRAVVFEGFRAVSRQSVAPPPLDLTRMVNSPRQGVLPTCGYSGRVRTTVTGGTVRFAYSGADGRVEYVWTPKVGHLGAFRAHAAMRQDASRTVVPAFGGRIEWTGPAVLRSQRLQPTRTGARCVKEYSVAGTVARLTLHARVVGKALCLDVSCDAPVIQGLDAGQWGPVLRRKPIAVPYYGTIQHAVAEGLFLNGYLDWTASAASSHSGCRATYAPRTDGARNRLRERAVFAAAWHPAEVLPNIPNETSPYRREVGSKIVLDIWGGRYTDIAAKLETLHDHGIRDCIAIIHDWQRSGYDNALPMHLPAAADKGGDTAMKTLVATATRLGYRIALHENYVDYYPNYDHFDERHIALDPTGQRILAWYNPGPKIQSFAVQPNAILPLATTQSPEIHRRFGTNACYLDVHSAVPPWFHVDARSSEPGSGTFGQVRDVHRRLFAYERATHKGPVFGEGNSHWYWSGMLDGVEAQFGTGWPANSGRAAPLFPDFNLLKVHPLQVNHGQGYYERWWDNLPWGAVPPMSLLDQYRMQEVVYGHTGFLGAVVWDRIPVAWLEHHLMTPVTSRHAGASVRSISYEHGGKWLGSAQATKVGDWAHPRIVYSNGLTVVANNARGTWRAHGATLPQHGWIAHGAGVTAYTAVRDGVICDYAETANSVFANARPASDWNLGGVLRVQPAVDKFRAVGPRRFEVTYSWRVDDPVPVDYHSFVHFSVADGPPYDEGIRFQQDHQLATPTSAWRPGSTVADGPHTIKIPDGIADGKYAWTTGLFVAGSARAHLTGPSDNSGRIILGTLIVADNGSRIAFEPHKGRPSGDAAMYAARLNAGNRVVRFAWVRTNGSVLIRREGSDWVLRTWPRKAFTLELSERRFRRPARIRVVGGPSPSIAPIAKGEWWSVPVNGATSYRWPANAGP